MELERSVFLIGYGAVDTIAYSYSPARGAFKHSEGKCLILQGKAEKLIRHKQGDCFVQVVTSIQHLIVVLCSMDIMHCGD